MSFSVATVVNGILPPRTGTSLRTMIPAAAVRMIAVFPLMAKTIPAADQKGGLPGTRMILNVKVSGGESYKDSDCMGDLVALNGMCESDGCNVDTHMNCYEREYIIQTKAEYCGDCGSSDSDYCADNS